jgi:uncharacterized protein YndB with AHSA1/START domain
MTSTRHRSATFEFTDRTVTFQRSFEAPMPLVFEVLTKPEHIRAWFPADDAPLHVCEVDLRVGGTFHFAWYAPGNKECAFRGTYLEIDRPTRIVNTWLFEGWPDDEAVETATLTQDGDVTTLTDVMAFKDAASFGDHFQGDNDGLQTSLDKLEDLLAELQARRSS